MGNYRPANTAPGPLRFRPSGAARFLGAGFLAIWLCGWAAGEVAALAVLGVGLVGLLTQSPLLGAEGPPAAGPALLVGGFLLVWVAFWTVGGLAAICELLRSIWAQDCIDFESGALLLERRLGPVRFRRRFDRAEIRHVFVRPTGALVAQVGRAAVTLTDLGSKSQRHDAAEHLRAALGLPQDGSIPDVLPEGWQELSDVAAGPAVVPDLQVRRKQALVVTLIAGVAWGGVALLLRAALRGEGQSADTAGSAVLAALLAVLAMWVSSRARWLCRGRHEWRLERGRLVHQRRFGWAVTELAEVRALELTESEDSDGDHWYTLQAVVPDAARVGKPGRRITIQRTIHDATEPRMLGLYLARRSGVKLSDLVPDEAQRKTEAIRLTEALAASGRFGRWLARHIRRSSGLPPDTELVEDRKQ